MQKIDTEKVLANVRSLIEKGATLKQLKGVSNGELEAVYSLAYGYYRTGRYEEAGKLTTEFWLDTEKFPDAGQTIRDEVARVNGTLSEFKRVQTVKTRDTEFPKTTTLKIIRNNRSV